MDSSIDLFSDEELSSIKSMLSHPNGHLKEDDFVFVKDNGFFHEYSSVKDNKPFSGWIVSAVDPKTLDIKDTFKIKLEMYMKTQGQVDGLLKVYGYFIKTKDASTLKQAVILTEPNAKTLSEFMQTEELTKEMYMTLVSTMSMTLNTLYRQNEYKMNYMSPQDVMVMEKRGKKCFKLFGLQNDGPMWGISMSLSEWASPELFKRLKFFSRERADMAKSLTYSFALVLIYAGNKANRPTLQRNSNKQETASESVLDQEERMLEGLIDVVARNYGLKSAQDPNKEKNELLLKTLRASVITDKEKRPGLEVWRQTDFTSLLNSTGSDPLQPRNTLGPRKATLPPIDNNLNVPKTHITLNSPQQTGKTEVKMRLPGSQTIMPQEEQKEDEGSKRSSQNNGESVRNALNVSQPRAPKPSIWSYLPKIDLDEMAPFSWLVGGFLGMIFIAILTVILLVSG